MRTSPSVVVSPGSVLLVGLAIAVILLPQGGNSGKLKYKCPEMYRRIGNGCYFISDERMTWHEAQFTCKDLAGGFLAKLNKPWKDRSLKRFLNRSEGVRLERWLGTIYDFGQNAWIWGHGGERLRYQGFSRMRPNDNYMWRCGVMDPIIYFRWGTRSCIEKKAFVCEVPIKIVNNAEKKKKMMKSRERNNKLRGGKRRGHVADIETNRIT